MDVSIRKLQLASIGLLVALLSLLCLFDAAYAVDFVVAKTADGTATELATSDAFLNYIVVDQEKHTCAVGGSDADSYGNGFKDSIKNDTTITVTIPEVVESEGQQWAVVGVNKRALAKPNQTKASGNLSVTISGCLDFVASEAFAGQGDSSKKKRNSLVLISSSRSWARSVDVTAFNYVVDIENDLGNTAYHHAIVFPDGSKVTGLDSDDATIQEASSSTNTIFYPASHNGAIRQNMVTTKNERNLIAGSPYASFEKNSNGDPLWRNRLGFSTLNVFVWSDSAAEGSLLDSCTDEEKGVIRPIAVLGDISLNTQVPEGASQYTPTMNVEFEPDTTKSRLSTDSCLYVKDGNGGASWYLQEDKDVTVKFFNSNNEEISAEDVVGPGSFKVQFTGNDITAWGVSPQYEFSLAAPADMSQATIALNETSCVYDAAEKKPDVTVTFENELLTENVDYALEYENNIDAGKAAVVIRGINGNTGTTRAEFEILPYDLATASVSWNIAGGTKAPWNGARQVPSVSVWPVINSTQGAVPLKPEDYTCVFPEDSTSCGEYSFTVVASNNGNCTGSVPGSYTYEIEPASIDWRSLRIKLSDGGQSDSGMLDDQPYSGEPISPEIPSLAVSYNTTAGIVTIDLVSDEDYVIGEWSNNINVGEATAVITGQKNLSGTVEIKFNIVPISIEGADVGFEDQPWTGENPSPLPSKVAVGNLLLTSNDYDVIYDYARLVEGLGIVEATVQGKGNYSGETTATFRIRKSIENAEVSVSDQDFTGEELKPEVTVKLGEDALVADRDFTVAYDNNTNVGTATVTVTGVDDYMGTVTGAFEIKVSEEDQAALGGLTNAINAIGTVTADSKAAVEAARAAYEALNDRQKALVSDEAKKALENAEAAYAEAVDAKAKADAEAKAKADAEAKAKAALAAASNVDKPTVTAADVKKASDLGATTITLGPKVKKIAKGAFKGTNIKTIVVKTKKLKKKSVKGSLKGSKVKTVKVQIGKKKVNKKYVKKYKKIFTKKNAGKKVKVK